MSAQNRAPSAYMGSKYRILGNLQKYLYATIPGGGGRLYDCYVEPCFGMGTLLFNSERVAEVEIINDSNSDVANFYKVLASKRTYKDFMHILKYTPYSQQIFIEARTLLRQTKKSYTALNVRRAWAFYLMCTMSVMRGHIGFSRDSIDVNKARAWVRSQERLDYVVERLKNCIIENEDGLETCKRYDSPRTFIYIDPPYLNVKAVEKMGVAYRGQVPDSQWHSKLLEWAISAKSRVMISNYHNELYDSMLTPGGGWTIEDIESYSSTIRAARATSASSKTIEVIWTKNITPPKQLSFM